MSHRPTAGCSPYGHAQRCTHTFDEADDAIDYGVIDEIARRVLLSGGNVLAVRADDIPDGGPAAGILRYAI